MKRFTNKIGLEERAAADAASAQNEQLNQSHLYAIVDIETTGGQPHQDKITEIAIFIHDGEKIVDKYHTLVNPERPIPYFITQLTGIKDDMVTEAPKFYEVAKEIVEFTEGKVFVAHNVRFDYSFLKKEFGDLGFTFQRKTLCTVRLSRSLIPGLPSYSLGKLCHSIDIPLTQRHRAIGDAEATALLFDKLIKINRPVVDGNMNMAADNTTLVLKKEIATSLLPPAIKKEQVDALPMVPGVYYFHNEAGEVIYVGKSINIKKRIIQHFNIDYKSRKSLDFKNSIADITYELMGNELVALLFESAEIKRMKPQYNRQQRRSVFNTGIFMHEDANGYKRLSYGTINRADNESLTPIIALSNHFKAKGFLFHKVAKYNLCQKLCDLYKTNGACFDFQVHQCNGACIGKESPEEYNKRVDEAIDSFTYEHNSFVLIGKGREPGEKSVVVVEHGTYLGFGFVDETFSAHSLDDFKGAIQRYNDNKDIQQIIRNHMRSKHKDKVIIFA
ncbi:exonuclease domain-containing protein [Pontibacter akesuensis]|uniref:DNA polymerase-3 subunit epsilon n=1 Tax=Pontibacter akesuensis TaxID=388950 RepID=A0A1I7FRZ8_9BACT|nr:exonuclease domain-containing protein [Pontibacter akesuensis]GHA60834.1 exonuclease [Pontibacter akesuensis]SFU38928.1 DNA polymerase-3 subunit epsilon [Pontibacter akesuensis]